MDGKERSSSKKTKGPSANHGMIGGKTVDGGKTASGSGNDGGTHRWPATYLMLELLLCFFCYISCLVDDPKHLDIYHMRFRL